MVKLYVAEYTSVCEDGEITILAKDEKEAVLAAQMEIQDDSYKVVKVYELPDYTA